MYTTFHVLTVDVAGVWTSKQTSFGKQYGIFILMIVALLCITREAYLVGIVGDTAKVSFLLKCLTTPTYDDITCSKIVLIYFTLLSLPQNSSVSYSSWCRAWCPQNRSSLRVKKVDGRGRDPRRFPCPGSACMLSNISPLNFVHFCWIP